jgi:hypothetical protein
MILSGRKVKACGIPKGITGGMNLGA